ncbi:M48 family metallopeptidase [Muricauda oceani]|jgi:predicted Zn-dependent protease|uniref:M48 family metalloprotease n=2 Tax=Flagellimonas TaxID=444459 RepID=A0A6G7IZK1_9FLAO|nr:MULTISPECIES: M48 family metallopeptidase [Allomuricauda]MBW8244682.1 M48 family metallopeptidase [Allomuricauda oceani]MDF0708775.1 M48 family metallopeptidase [[Muricauda] okinawensis]QII43622.1 M48 family metalloprotease [Allomuricauda oceani]
MKPTFSTLLVILLFKWSGAQELPLDKLDEAIAVYTSKVEDAALLNNCGHAFDGPAFLLKQAENNWLDFALYISSNSKSSIGREIYSRYVLLGQLDNTHFAKEKVEEILQKISKNVSRKGINYKLSILKSDEINAFATLGGYLYITTGLLDFVDSYDELAFIIGHEVAHEDRLHTQRKVTKLTLSTDLGDMTRMEGFAEIASKINKTLAPPFDQIDEYEADKVGFELAKAAGYDVNRFADFFKKLERYEKQDLLRKLTSTHPFAEHRKNCIHSYIDNNR